MRVEVANAIQTAMWTYYPDLLAAPVPRYTSYPTAAQFSDSVGAADLAARLDAVADDATLSLYVHIPYCHDICWYCGCNTGSANRSQRVASYVDALEREIALVSARLAGRGRVRRIAFGGGSPNSLPLVDFVRLLHQIILCFGIGAADISVELDPRRLDAQWAAAMGAVGVGRVNMGVQTFAPHVQAGIGRIQPLDMVERAMADLRHSGVGDIGFDLLYGLPGQSLADLSDTLDHSIALAPARVALFGYAHMPHLLPRQRRIDGQALPNMDQRFAMAALGYDRLTAAGYQAIGFDHFALPHDNLAVAARNGKLRRNFQGFTDDDSDVLIGLGASAISMFPDLLVQNEKNVGRYRMLVSADRLPAARGVTRSVRDQRIGRLIEDILCNQSIVLGDEDVGPALAHFETRGLVARDGPVLRRLPGGLPYVRAIAATFDPYLRPEERRFSNAI
ncbi:oxygen-independent coproporphyrinogen III oxidase [soil metagenome]